MGGTMMRVKRTKKVTVESKRESLRRRGMGQELA